MSSERDPGGLEYSVWFGLLRSVQRGRCSGYMPVTPILRRQRQETHKVQASLDYIRRDDFKKNKGE